MMFHAFRTSGTTRKVMANTITAMMTNKDEVKAILKGTLGVVWLEGASNVEFVCVEFVRGVVLWITVPFQGTVRVSVLLVRPGTSSRCPKHTALVSSRQVHSTYCLSLPVTLAISSGELRIGHRLTSKG